MIYWKDLGCQISKISYSTEIVERYADWWDADVQPWLDQNIKHDYNPSQEGVWFADPNDAMLFKLVWSGQCPDT